MFPNYFNCTSPADWMNMVSQWRNAPGYNGEHEEEIEYGKGGLANVISLSQFRAGKDLSR